MFHATLCRQLTTGNALLDRGRRKNAVFPPAESCTHVVNLKRAAIKFH